MTSFTSRKRVLAAEVHAILSESGSPMTSKQISDMTGHTVREIVGALRILDDAGAVYKIRCEKHFEWSVPGVASLPRMSPHCTERAECRVRIINLMTGSDAPMTKAEIAESIGADLQMVSSILYNLRRDGKVRTSGGADQWEVVR